jgi:hypothetical protein
VSDLVLTNEQIKTAKISIKGYEEPILIANVWDSAVEDGMVTEDLVSPSDTIMFVRKAGAEFFGIVFPECGIYFIKFDEEFYTTSLTTTEPIEHTKTVVHKLDKKFIEKTMLYVDDGHLYHDAAFTRKVSAAELNSMMDYGVMLKVNHYVYFPLMYEYDAKYGSLLSYMTEDGLAGAITKEADNES